MSDPFPTPPTTEPLPLEATPTSAPAGPGAADAASQRESPPAPGHRRRGDVGMVLSAALLSALLASGATAALEARPTTTGATAAATTPTITTALSTAAGTSSSIASIVATANPAVVTIETTVTGTGRGVRGLTGTGVGSGFIYDANGSILTAAHVVEGASGIKVTLADGRTFQGTVAASNLTLDVAVVKIDATGLPSIPLATTKAQVGQTVLAIGDPLGNYPGSATVGIVSGLDRSLTVADDLTGRPHDLTGMIQTDAAINPGNSGGPLINASGKVIGIISASSSDAQGMGFAVPISAAATVMATAKAA
jgi:serine protease Do